MMIKNDISTAHYSSNEIVFTSEFTVKLVHYTASDQYVYNAAKVSTLGEKILDEGHSATKKGGLIKFLMKNRHGTPFEHNSFTFFISAPIFVFREFMRHRIGFSYNEESGRYKQLMPVFYLPGRDRALVQTGKVGDYSFIAGSDQQHRDIVDAIRQCSTESYKRYCKLIDSGIAKEVARVILPVNIYTSMYMTCNARSLMSFLSLRTQKDGSFFKSFPMKEIEQVGLKLEELWKEVMPITHSAFVQFGRVSP
jgi:thymidylate synthase (FAD)